MALRQRILIASGLMLAGGFFLFGNRSVDGRAPTIGSLARVSSAQPTNNQASRNTAAVKSLSTQSQNPKMQPTQGDQSGLVALQKTSTHRWDANRLNEFGLPKTLIGGKWSLPNTSPQQMAQEFINSYARSIFGVDPENLKLAKVVGADRVKYIFAQYASGVPIYGASLSLAFEQDAVIRVQNDLVASDVPVFPTRLSMEESLTAIQNGSLKVPTGRGGSFQILQENDPTAQTMYYYNQGHLVPAYHFFATAEGNIEHFELMLDANTQHLIFAHSTRLD